MRKVHSLKKNKMASCVREFTFLLIRSWGIFRPYRYGDPSCD